MSLDAAVCAFETRELELAMIRLAHLTSANVLARDPVDADVWCHWVRAHERNYVFACNVGARVCDELARRTGSERAFAHLFRDAIERASPGQWNEYPENVPLIGPYLTTLIPTSSCTDPAHSLLREGARQ